MLENIETEALCNKREMKNEWKINFLKNSSLSIQHIYSREFSNGRNTSEILL